MLYTYDLGNSINERTHFFIKIYLSLFILERVDVSVVCERWVERHILRERTSSSHIFSRKPGGVNASSSETPLIDCVSHARLRFSALCLNLTAWFSLSDPLLVTHLFDLSALARSHLPVYKKLWQLTKAHGVTRNEPKIHVICYITPILWLLKLWYVKGKFLSETFSHNHLFVQSYSVSDLIIINKTKKKKREFAKLLTLLSRRTKE